MKPGTLLTEEELIDVAERAITLLFRDDDLDTGSTRERRRRLDLELMAARAALRCCATSAALLGEVRLLPRLVRWLGDMEGLRDDGLTVREELLEAITTMVQGASAHRATVSGKSVRKLATSRRHDARLALATGLMASTPEAVALLETLAQDPHASVRREARAQLAKVQEVPWWLGKFDRDPLPRVDPEAAETLKPVFEAIDAWFERPSHERAQEVASLTSLVRKLPDELAVELSARYLSQPSQRDRDPALDLARDMLTREGGPEALWRVVSRSSEYSFQESGWYRRLLTPLDREQRQRAGAFFLDRVRKATPAQRAEQSGAAALAGEALLHAWPDDVDPTPVLDVYLALEPPEKDEIDFAGGSLRKLLERPSLDRSPIAERMVGALAEGLIGRWRQLTTAVYRGVEGLPADRRRVVVERALEQTAEAKPERSYTEAERKRQLRWALEQITGEAYDPSRDGERPTLIRRLLDDPTLRQALFSSPALSARALGPLREELVRGTLSPGEATATLEAIGRAFGGVVGVSFLSSVRHRGQDEKQRAEALAAGEAWLSDDHKGPPTEPEWRAYRERMETHGATRARGQSAAEGPIIMPIGCLPEGAWRPEDRALFDREVERWRADPDQGTALGLAALIRTHPRPDHLPVLDELRAYCEQHARSGLALLDLSIEEVHDVLGIAPDRVAADPGELDWMDEPED